MLPRAFRQEAKLGKIRRAGILLCRETNQAWLRSWLYSGLRNTALRDSSEQPRQCLCLMVLTRRLSVEDAACQSADTAAGSTGTPESDEEAGDVGTTSSYFCNNANQRRKRKRLPNFRESKRKKTSHGGSQQFHCKGYVVVTGN